MAAQDAEFRAGVSLFRRDRATSVRPKPAVSAITLAYADAAIQVRRVCGFSGARGYPPGLGSVTRQKRQVCSDAEAANTCEKREK